VNFNNIGTWNFNQFIEYPAPITDCSQQVYGLANYTVPMADGRKPDHVQLVVRGDSSASGKNCKSHCYSIETKPGFVQVGCNDPKQWPTPPSPSTASPTGNPTSNPEPTKAQITPLQYFPLDKPVRILDTRSDRGGAKLTGTLDPPLSVLSAGVPLTALAIAGGVQAVECQNPGYLSVWPDGVIQPTTSSANYQPPLMVYASLYSGISSAGMLSIFTQTATHVIVDISGYFAPKAAGGLWYSP
jgi:hypothetical protein